MAVRVLGLNLDCQNCDNILKEERGCHKEGKVGWQLDNTIIKRCPKKLITAQSWEYINCYSFFDKGLLPNNKSWRDESEKFLTAMYIIEKELNKMEKEKCQAKN